MTGLHPSPAPVAQTEWLRLDRRIVLAYLSSLLPPALGVPLLLVSTGGALSRKGLIWIVLLSLGFVALTCYGLLKYTTTRYRVTEERVELRSAILARNTKTLRRDVIRTVDVTANPLYRILGITVVRIGTGAQGSGAEGQLSLDGIPKEAAQQLRRRLQHGETPGPDHGVPAHPTGTDRPAQATGTAGTAGAADPIPAPAAVLAQLNWSWLRFAPLTLLGIGGFIAAPAAAYETLDQAGVDPLDLPVLTDLAAWSTEQPLWLPILVVSAAALLLAVIGTLLAYTEAWWGFTLEREGRHLRVQRGLLTTRSFSVDRQRLLGTEVTEPLLLRCGGGARTKALVAGLRNDEGDGSQPATDLLPPAPKAHAFALTSQLLGPSVHLLTSHPRAALSRRRVRAALAVLAVTALCAAGALLWTPLLYVAAGCLLVLTPAAWWLAGDAYRALGHTVTDDLLIVRSGTFIRRTVTLRRASVIGWTLKQSPTQKRTGLATLVATIAAGDGTCPIRDLALADIPALTERTLPHLLPPTNTPR